MSTPMPTPSLIPCQIRYSTKLNFAELGEALSLATRKLSTRMPLKLTGAEGHPAWMIESPGLHSMLMVMHSDFRAASDETTDEAQREMAEDAAMDAPRCIDIKYRDADRGAVEDLAALLGCSQRDVLVDVDASDMSTDEPYSATEYLLMASGRELAQGFHILDMAFASGQELVQDYTGTLVSELLELSEIRKAIEAGDAEARFGKERLARYLREAPKPIVAGENTVDRALPHILYIPSSSDITLRVHYAWDAKRQVHVIGYMDEHNEGP